MIPIDQESFTKATQLEWPSKTGGGGGSSGLNIELRRALNIYTEENGMSIRAKEILYCSYHVVLIHLKSCEYTL